MNLFKTFINNRRKKSFQAKNGNRNRAALQGLLFLGFPLKNIRRSLVELNAVSLSDIAAGQVVVPTISNNIKGRGAKGDSMAKTLIAQKFGLEVNELFPDRSDHARS